MSFAQQMLDIPAGSFVNYTDPETGKQVQLHVRTAERVFPHREYKTSAGNVWKRSGDTWPALYCSMGTDEHEALLIVIGMNEYIFTAEEMMGPEGASQYVPLGQKFGQTHNVAFDHDGDSYAINAIGQWDVEAHEGEPHIPPGQEHPARLIVAWGPKVSETSAGQPVLKALLVEDSNVGSDHDRVWLGRKVFFGHMLIKVLPHPDK